MNLISSRKSLFLFPKSTNVIWNSNFLFFWQKKYSFRFWMRLNSPSSLLIKPIFPFSLKKEKRWILIFFCVKPSPLFVASGQTCFCSSNEWSTFPFWTMNLKIVADLRFSCLEKNQINSLKDWWRRISFPISCFFARSKRNHFKSF